MTNEVWDGLEIDVDALANHGQATIISYDGQDLQRWVAYFKAGIAEVQARIGTTAAALRSVSTTNLTIGAGAKSATIGTGKGFAAGDWTIFFDPSNPTTKWMVGIVTSYTSSTGEIAFTVGADDYAGSGSHANWTVGLSAQPGPEGPEATPDPASETVAGIAEIATQPEVDARTDDERIVTARKLAAYIDALAIVPANVLINPEGYIFQRTAPTTDNAYAWDRWRLLLGAANAATVSQLTSGLPTNAKNAMRLTVGSGNNNKFGIFQIIEGVNVYALRGRAVCLQAQIKATAGLTDIRMAIVEWTGTEDATSGDPIANWQAMATVPTYAAGWANLNTPANLAVATSFAQYSVTATVGAAATNLAVFIWSEDTSNTQTTDILDITMAVLSVTASAITYNPRQHEIELALCQRYCTVFAHATAVVASGRMHTTTEAVVIAPLPTAMRATPTLTVSSAAHFNIAASGSTVALSALVIYGTSNMTLGLSGTLSSAVTGGDAAILEGGNASAKLTLTAEL